MAGEENELLAIEKYGKGRIKRRKKGTGRDTNETEGDRKTDLTKLELKALQGSDGTQTLAVHLLFPHSFIHSFTK